jgi:hypothetical protein
VQLSHVDPAGEVLVGNEELGATVGNFASRIRRKLKEQEVQKTNTNRAAGQRQALMLKAMTGVRKALQDAAKISLGNRFFFELEIADLEGWPRLELKLIDSSMPDLQTQSLIATANDRNELGTLQLQMRGGEILGRVHLRDEEEFNRLPLIMKKSLRAFLDVVALLVLNPTNPEDSLAAQTAPLEDGFDGDFASRDLAEEDVFSADEGYSRGDNRVEIEDTPSNSGFAFAMPLKA